MLRGLHYKGFAERALECAQGLTRASAISPRVLSAASLGHVRIRHFAVRKSRALIATIWLASSVGDPLQRRPRRSISSRVQDALTGPWGRETRNLSEP